MKTSFHWVLAFAGFVGILVFFGVMFARLESDFIHQRRLLLDTCRLYRGTVICLDGICECR